MFTIRSFQPARSSRNSGSPQPATFRFGRNAGVLAGRRRSPFSAPHRRSPTHFSRHDDGVTNEPQTPESQDQPASTDPDFSTLTNAQWRDRLTAAEYLVLREGGTERPWSGEYVATKDDGTYACRACGNPLFTSDTKFEAHCGWPSFYETIDPSAVRELRDSSHGMERIEVRCSRCDGHLGHVFNDGPRPTGLRYCMNSVSLQLLPATDGGDV